MELTPKQKQVIDAIQELTNRLGKPPTLNELKDYLGYGNTSSVQRHVYALITKGAIANDKNKSRSYTIPKPVTKMVKIPLVGTCPCGTPLLAQENIEAYIPYEASKLKDNYRDYFFLRAQGDSMNKAHVSEKTIDSGDFVLVKRQPSADFGSRVVALIGDEATIKKLVRGEGCIRLEPESTNPANKPIILVDNFSIQGIVVDVIKRGCN